MSVLSIEVDRAIGRLKSLHDGDGALSDVIGLGRRAVPELRNILLERDPSGLYYTRCRAAEALTTLGAYDVLTEFLHLERSIGDPIERLGEDAVINAAARGIARARDEGTFRLLTELAKHRPLSGVIGALGTFQRIESIPQLIAALAEDDVRMTAAAALGSIGPPTKPALIVAATLGAAFQTYESESNLRQRRTALALLLDIGVSRKEWPALRTLMQDKDTQISILACKACFDAGDRSEHPVAIQRFNSLRPGARWFERLQIDHYLAERPD